MSRNKHSISYLTRRVEHLNWCRTEARRLAAKLTEANDTIKLIQESHARLLRENQQLKTYLSEIQTPQIKKAA